MQSSIQWYAGKRALAQLRANGLRADDVEVVLGAAGGPKWFVLQALDKFLFSQWFANRDKPLHLLGSSIGSWRFAAACCAQPAQATEVLLQNYLQQVYTVDPTAEEVSEKSKGMIKSIFSVEKMQEILSHPSFKLWILTNRCKLWTDKDHDPQRKIGLAAAALVNTVLRDALSLFFDRVIFRHADAANNIIAEDNFYTEQFDLNLENIYSALLASGSIPIVMNGVQEIAGATAGVYRDGGIIDYHLNLDFRALPGLVLYPHFTPKVIAGWLDKFLPLRHANANFMDNWVLIAPSKEFVQSLPEQKIPDRKDFKTYEMNPQQRIGLWQQAIKASERIAEDFQADLAQGNLARLCRPIEEVI